MVFKSGRINTLFTELIFKLSSLSGLTPFFDFQQRKLKYTKLFKCYSFFLSQLLVFMFLARQYNNISRYSSSQSSDQFIYIIVLLKDTASLILILATILGSVFWKKYKWQDFFSKIYALECEFDVCVALKKRCAIFNDENLLLLVGSFNFFLFLIHLYISYLSHNGYAYYNIFVQMTSYFYFIMSTFAFGIILFIKRKYERINILLCTFKFSDVLNSSLNQSFRKTTKIFSAMYDITEGFNELFGYSLSVFLLYVVFQILLAFSGIISLSRLEGHVLNNFTLKIFCISYEVFYWVVSSNHNCNICIFPGYRNQFLISKPIIWHNIFVFLFSLAQV